MKLYLTIAGQYCEVLHGTSYNCPALKLYGFSTETALARAIRQRQRQIENKNKPHNPEY